MKDDVLLPLLVVTTFWDMWISSMSSSSPSSKPPYEISQKEFTSCSSCPSMSWDWSCCYTSPFFFLFSFELVGVSFSQDLNAFMKYSTLMPSVGGVVLVVGGVIFLGENLKNFWV
jgi:hypothetical protein